MSILATITVVKCDQCEKIETLRSEDQYQNYERQWHTGVVTDVCPDCRIASDAKTEIDQEVEAFLESVF